jgi:hypothetical protein
MARKDPAQIVEDEVNARFWAQTKYRVGKKLDPWDQQDATMIPVWKDIEAKVQRDYDAGKLVTTFDHPVVAQNLADAHVADQMTIAHAEAAAKTPDSAAAQQHAEAAATASEIVAQKTQDAAAIQPPTVSPQLSHEASHAAASQPPHPSAPASDHVAHVQAQAAHKPSPHGIIDRETNARFWAQSHYRPGQRLDPSNPTDARMIRVWLDIYRKVKREDDAGELVITYNHPVVAQNLADAHVADKVAAASLDAAAATTDPWAVQENVAAAVTASQIASQKTREAAQLQPPTVSPPLAHEAGQKIDERTVMRPEHLVSGRDHLAQEQARAAGRKAAGVHHDHHDRHGHRRHHPKSTVHPGRVKDFESQATRLAHQAGSQFVLVIQHPDGTPEHRVFGTRAELDAEYTKLSDQHDQYIYIAAFDLAVDPNASVHHSVGIPAAEHADVPAPPSGEPAVPSEPAPTPGPPDEKPGWSTGKKLAIAAVGVAVLGGIAFAVSRKTSRSATPRTRMPKVIVATPTSTRPL